MDALVRKNEELVLQRAEVSEKDVADLQRWASLACALCTRYWV
jgi:hypothetical protein